MKILHIALSYGFYYGHRLVTPVLGLAIAVGLYTKEAAVPTAPQPAAAPGLVDARPSRVTISTHNTTGLTPACVLQDEAGHDVLSLYRNRAGGLAFVARLPSGSLASGSLSTTGEVEVRAHNLDRKLQIKLRPDGGSDFDVSLASGGRLYSGSVDADGRVKGAFQDRTP